jgi:hypothetical protein
VRRLVQACGGVAALSRQRAHTHIQRTPHMGNKQHNFLCPSPHTSLARTGHDDDEGTGESEFVQDLAEGDTRLHAAQRPKNHPSQSKSRHTVRPSTLKRCIFDGADQTQCVAGMTLEFATHTRQWLAQVIANNRILPQLCTFEYP